MMPEDQLILPMLDQDTKEYWEAAKRHELRIQRCLNCKTFRHPPRPMCPNCQSMEHEWTRASGRGEVHSYTVCYKAAHPAMENKLPYAVVLVDLEEGVRLVSNIVDCGPESLAIGMSVEVVFDDVTPEITLPRFKRRTAGGASHIS